MINVRLILFAALTLLSSVFVLRWVTTARRARPGHDRDRLDVGPEAPTATQVAIGLVTNFFDTLGIGSFATTTTIYKLLRMVPDEHIPGTMIVGHALPVVAQAFIFISVVNVDSTTLGLLVAGSVLGGWFGAGVVTRLPRRAIQVGMGIALFAAAFFMTMSNLQLFPGGGTAFGLSGFRLAMALAVNIVLGALVTIGIGNYAPSLVLFSLLGMEPRAAFPIMMGTGAFVAGVAGIRFMTVGRYHLRAAVGLTMGGIPGVLIAAFLVKSLPLEVVRWMVVCIVVYTAATMLRSAYLEGFRIRRAAGLSAQSAAGE